MKILSIFGLAILAKSVFGDCTADYSKYESCDAKAKKYDTISTGKDIEEFCKSFEVDECKDFVSIATEVTECLNDKDKVQKVAAIQFPYLAFCAKKEDKKSCPVSSYIQDNFDTVNQLYGRSFVDSITSKVTNTVQGMITKKIKEAVKDDCKDSACNKRMITLGKSIKKDGVSSYADEVLGSTKSFFDEIYKVYEDGTCELHFEGEEESGANQLQIITFSFIGMILLSIARLF